MLWDLILEAFWGTFGVLFVVLGGSWEWVGILMYFGTPLGRPRFRDQGRLVVKPRSPGYS